MADIPPGAVLDRPSADPSQKTDAKDTTTETGAADQTQSPAKDSMTERIKARMRSLAGKVQNLRERNGRTKANETLRAVAADKTSDTSPTKPIDGAPTSEGFDFKSQKERLDKKKQLPPDKLKDSADSGNILAKTALREKEEKETTSTHTGSADDLAETKPLPPVEDTSQEPIKSAEDKTDEKSWWKDKREQMVKNKEFRRETRKLVKEHYNWTGFAKTKDAEGNTVNHARLYSKELNKKHEEIYGEPFLPSLDPQERKAAKEKESSLSVVDILKKNAKDKMTNLAEMLDKYGLTVEDLSSKDLTPEKQTAKARVPQADRVIFLDEINAATTDEMSANYANHHSTESQGQTLQETLQKDIAELNSRIDPDDFDKMRTEKISIGGKEYTLLQAQDIIRNTVNALSDEDKAKIDLTAGRKTHAEEATPGDAPEQQSATNQRLDELRNKARADIRGNGKITSEELTEYQKLLTQRDAGNTTTTQAAQTETTQPETNQPNDELAKTRKNFARMSDEQLQDRLALAEKFNETIERDEAKKILDQRKKARESSGGTDAAVEDTAGETTTTSEEPSEGQQELPRVNDALKKTHKQNIESLVKVMTLNGLNLDDIEQHAELFNLDPQDLAVLSTMDEKSLDEALSDDKDPLLKGIREKLLADDPQHPDARYATAKGAIRQAIEATATDLRAKSYLEQLSQTTGKQELTEALRLDREKLQAAGGVEGDVAELRQKKVTLGGMEMDVIAADNVLSLLEKL